MNDANSYQVAARPAEASGLMWAALCSLAVLITLALRVFGAASHFHLFMEDDAYYYTVIAQHVAATGVSTFDGHALTNGYHPLWLLLLVLQDLTVGPSILITFLLEAALFSASIGIFLRSGPVRRPASSIIFTLVFLLCLYPMVLSGMEVALLLFCISIFAWSLTHARDNGRFAAVALGMSATFCVFARLDSAVFIGPALLFAPCAVRTKWLAFAIVLGFGAMYAALNLAIFGMMFPVSGAIKSLGGLQINHPYLTQLTEDVALHGVRSRYIWLLAGMALSPVIWWYSPRRSVGRALAAASVVGSLLFMFKIIFLSSWRLWPWYNFPFVFAVVPGLFLLLPSSEVTLDRFGLGPAHGSRFWRACTLVAVGALAGLILISAARLNKFTIRDADFEAVNERAIAKYGGVLNGQPVGMGDRAGSFAAHYHGPVVQLEGLVNDKAYLAALKRGGDITDLLCRRGVKFIADYETDLGVYTEHKIEFLRPRLTQFHGPTIMVYRRDEVGTASDVAAYDNRALGDEGNNVLYIWRIGKCE